MLGYEVELTPDDNETLMATCPALPEVASYGDDRADALRHVALAIEEALASRMADWEWIPNAEERSGNGEFVALPAHVLMKLSLYWLMRANEISRAELQRRLGWHREQVDRLFRLDHASRVEQIEAALSAIGFHLNVSVEPELA